MMSALASYASGCSLKLADLGPGKRSSCRSGDGPALPRRRSPSRFHDIPTSYRSSQTALRGGRTDGSCGAIAERHRADRITSRCYACRCAFLLRGSEMARSSRCRVGGRGQGSPMTDRCVGPHLRLRVDDARFRAGERLRVAYCREIPIEVQRSWNNPSRFSRFRPERGRCRPCGKSRPQNSGMRRSIFPRFQVSGMAMNSGSGTLEYFTLSSADLQKSGCIVSSIRSAAVVTGVTRRRSTHCRHAIRVPVSTVPSWADL